MQTLYCLPLGETKRYDFIKEAGQYPYGQALIVVPGRYFSKEVNKAGTARSAIIDYLPNEILRLNNYAGNFVRISRAAQEMLVQQILLELREAGKLTYFAGLVDKSGFTKSFTAFIGELARGEVTAEQLKIALEHWERDANLALKDQEVALIYETYSQRLQASTFYDVDGLYRLAINLLEQGQAKLPWQKLYFTEFYQFNSLQLELLKSLSKYCDIAVGLFYDKNKETLAEATRQAYEDLIGLGFTARQETAHVKRAADLQQLVDSWQGKKHQPIVNKNIQILEAYSLEQEMRMVLTGIKELLLAGIKQEEILCLVRHLDDYNGFSDLFTEYGIPTTLARVTNFSGQLLPDFLNRLFETALLPQDVQTWQKLLAHPLCGELYGVNGEKLEESYNEKFFATVQGLKQFAEQDCGGTKLAELTALLQSLSKKHTPEELKDLLTAALEKWSLLKKWGEAFSQDKLTMGQLKILAASQQAVEELLEKFLLAFEQSGLANTKIGLGDFLAFWQEQSRGILLPTQEEKSHGVLVAEIANLQGVNFPYVFLLGMREGVFPSLKAENWIYNDVERLDLLNKAGVPLKVSSMAMHQEQFFFGEALAIATKKLTLSYFADDGAGASSYLENLKSYFTEDSLPVCSWQEDVSNCASVQALLKILVQNKKLASQDAAWAQNYLGRDFSKLAALDIGRWTEQSPYNGNIDRESTYKEFSASALDNYIACPFSYLAGRVWQTAPWAPLTEEVEPTTRGDLFHATVAKFLGRYKQKNLNDYPEEKLQQQLATDFNFLYAKFSAAGQIIQSSFADYEKKNMLQALSNWLTMERDYQNQETLNLLPYYLEQPFGRQTDNSWPQLELEVEGETIKFSGQIDRIDFDGVHYMITDYKTGGYPTGVELSKGQALQLPLYVLAVEQFAKTQEENILGAGYFSFKEGKRKAGAWQPTMKEQLNWLNRSRAPELATVLQTAKASITHCVKQIKAGAFPAKPAKKACPAYCPYADICRYRLSVATEDTEEIYE